MIALLVNRHPEHKYANKTYTNFFNQGATLYLTNHSIAEIYRSLTWGVGFLKYSSESATKSIIEVITPHFLWLI